MVTQTERISAASTSLRVLVVEDHPDTLYALGGLLRHKGLRVIAAASPEEALGIPRDEYDLAIIDILTPQGMDGCELMCQLVERHGPLRAIAFSVAGAERDLSRCRDSGFSAHVLKPDMDKLLAALDALAADAQAN